MTSRNKVKKWSSRPEEFIALHLLYFQKVITAVAAVFLEENQLVENVGCSPVHQGWNLVFCSLCCLVSVINQPCWRCVEEPKQLDRQEVEITVISSHRNVSEGINDEINMCSECAFIAYQLARRASGKSACLSSDHRHTELCTEHAQRSQLWHLSGEQSAHCVPL